MPTKNPGLGLSGALGPALLLLISALGVPAFAADDLAAVGRVGTFAEDGSGGCSAVLIAPDLVLGAAHCLIPAGGDLAFRPGQAVGKPPPGAYPGRLSVRHPIHVLGFGPPRGRIGYDVGVLQLAEPVPPEVARPLALGARPVAGERLIVAGYRGGKGERARQRACPLLAEEDRWLILGCEVLGGESGSPVLRPGPGGPEIVAVVVARMRLRAQPVAAAPVTELALPAVIEALEALEAGADVAGEAPPETTAPGAGGTEIPTIPED